MSSYFITATGTDIGKTFTTCALIRAARAQGKSVHAVKPIISGFDHEQFAISDTGAIIDALGLSPQEINKISPWRFSAPLSPNMAAAREHQTIDFDALVHWSRAQLNHADFTFIEGVGGAMVPLSDTHTVRDWIAALSLPVILVTGSYLGSISHTLTTIEALRAVQISIKAIIISESIDASVSLDETLATITAHTGDIPLRIAQPRVSSPQQAGQIHTLLEQL